MKPESMLLGSVGYDATEQGGAKICVPHKKCRLNKRKKTDSEHLQLFWMAPIEAFFGQETIAFVVNCSIKTLECDRWRKSGIPFRKVSGRVLYRKIDVINYLESHDPVVSTSQYKSKEGKTHVA